MKFNKAIMALLLIFIAAVSMSAVSAADADDTAVADEIVAAPAVEDQVDYATEEIATQANNIIEIPDGANYTYVQEAINNANASDIISFAENGHYDWGNNDPINVDKTLTFQGNNATIVGLNGFLVQASETTSVDGTSFYNFNFETYGKNASNPDQQAWNGRAIDVRSASDIMIANNTFLNGHSSVYLRGMTGSITLVNNTFRGVGSTNTSTLRGDDETGTKGISIMGGNGIYIADNVFEGDLLDGISIASNARNVTIENNLFVDNYYGIFYGGGVRDIVNVNNTYVNNQIYAIGLVKSSSDTLMEDNVFYIPNNAVAIYLEQGNTAHGAATTIGDIQIIDNEFYAYDNSTYGMIAVEVASENGPLQVADSLTILNNTRDNEVIMFQFIDNGWDIDGDDIIIYPSQGETNIVAEEGAYEYADVYEIQLVGEGGIILADQDVEINIIRGDEIVNTFTATTDERGIASFLLAVPEEGNYTINVVYNGTDGLYNNVIFDEASANFDINVEYRDVIVAAENMTIASSVGNRFNAVFYDENNVLLTNTNVTFTINGVTYNRTTDANGEAGLNINLNMGTYNITAGYDGGDGLKAVNTTYQINVTQGTTRIICTDYNETERGTPFEVQLVNLNGVGIANHVVCFHINGVAYYKTTDANGYATLSINLNRGIYNMYISFDGTLQYAGCNGGAEITTNW